MYDCKNDVETLFSLHTQAREVQERLLERLEEVARRFINAYHDTNSGYGFPQDTARFEFSVDFDYSSSDIRCEWEEFWSYGGHDAGEFYIPANYLYDESALDAYELKRSTEKKSDASLKIAKERASKLKQIEKLKKELES